MLNISSVVFLTKFVSKKAVFASFVSSNSLCFKCKQKTPKEQTKKCIKFHTRMNLISLMRCHSLVARLAHIHLHTLMRVQLHFHLHINQMRVSAVQLISTVINFFALCVFADAYWIGWLIDCAMHNETERVQHTVYCVGDGSWCVIEHKAQCNKMWHRVTSNIEFCRKRRRYHLHN